MTVHPLWTPGPWGPDIGRAMDSKEIEQMQADREAERLAAERAAARKSKVKATATASA